MRRKYLGILVSLVLLAIAGGVVAQYYFAEGQAPVQLRVFVASSLIHAVQDNGTLQAFEKANKATALFNVGGSDSLYAQIYAGSPADVYMAADSSWLVKLKQNGLLYNDKYWNFTSNILIVILPPDNPKNIKSLSDLAAPGVRIAVSAWTVPAGKYTNITITKIDKTWGNKASNAYKGTEWENYRQRVIANIVTYETTVEQVVGKVLSGTADAGFAYGSDAAFLGQSKLKSVPIPSDVNIQAAYGIGVLKNSTHYAVAMNYVNFWLSQEGQKLLTKYGFGSTLSSTASISEIGLQLWIVQEANYQERKVRA